MIEITQHTNTYITTFCYFIIEIILLASYGDSNSRYTYDGDIKTFLELSLAGSVIMMLSFLATMILNYKYHKYGLYCLLAAFPFAVFLLLIGMGFGSQYYTNTYNVPVAFWFIQVALLVLAYLNLYIIFKNQGDDGAQPKGQAYQAPSTTQPNNISVAQNQ